MLPTQIRDYQMKSFFYKRLAVFVLISAALTACSIFGGDNEEEFTVTFDSNGGSPVQSQKIWDGGWVNRPSPEPTKSGYLFVDWYKDAALTIAWDFNTDKVTSKMTLYAKWATESYYIITGKVENVSECADVAKVKVGASLWDSNTLTDVYETLASGDLRDGSFTLRLPTTISSKWYNFVPIDVEIPSSVTVSNKDVKYFKVYLFAGCNSADKIIGRFYCRRDNFAGGGKISVEVSYWYVETDVNISGTSSFTQNSDNYVYEYNSTYLLDLKKGWNVVIMTHTSNPLQGNTFTSLTEYTIGSAVNDLQWNFYLLTE